VTLGATAPTLGTDMLNIDTAQTVTVKVPNNPAWSGKTGTFTGNNATDNWGNGFRGGGWNGTGMTNSANVNSNITVIVEYE
jgi:hypothetical protein